MAPCRNGTNRAPNGRCIALKREDRVLEQQQQSKLIPKQRSNKPRYRRTCRRIWNQGCKKAIKPAKMSGEQLRRIAKVMHELHLPFPASNERRADITKNVLPSYLRCSINDDWDSEEECWKDAKYPLEHRFTSIEHASPHGPCWNQPPTSVAHLEILKSLIHFWRICSRAQYLQIPSYWPVFDGASWGPHHYLHQATTNSSDNKIPKHYVHDPHCPIPFEGDSDAGDRENVKCEAGKVLGARLRGFWAWISALVPHRFDWHHQTRECALRRHRRRHVGYLDLNQTSHNYDIWPQKSIEALLCCWEQGYCPHELGWPSILGRLITNVVATDVFPTKNREPLHWPAPFAQLGDMPVIDYTCRARKELMGWQGDFSPLLFAAQYKGNDGEHAVGRLAMAFQPMMSLFVLYHLDCRRSKDEPLPSWMVLYGATYDEDGLIIHAHAPYFSPPRATAAITPDWGWCSVSSSAVNKFHHIVHKAPNARGSLIATLNRIQGHCSHVLDMLKAWDGYERAVSRILQT